MEEKNEEIENEQINNIDNLTKEKDNEELEIDQIDNIENLKNDLYKKEDSFSSEDSNEKLNKIFGIYPLGIDSLTTVKN